MFCIGKKIFEIFVGVIIIVVEDNIVIVKGFKGELICIFNVDMFIKIEENILIVECLFE